MASSVEKMEVDPNMTLTVKQEIEDDAECDVLASQKLEIKKEIDVEKMEVESECLPVAVPKEEDSLRVKVETTQQGTVPKEEEDSLRVKVETTQQGTVKLSVEGVEDCDSEETITMTPEEVRSYLELKIGEYLKDSKINPLLELTKHSQELEEEIKVKNEEYNKLNKLFELIYRNQKKFLRQIGILPKIPTNSIPISVDLPVLPNSVPAMPSNISTEYTFLKKDTTVPKVTTSSQNRPVTPAVPGVSALKEPSKPVESVKKIIPKPAVDNIECIDLTDDIDVPNTAATKSASNFASLMLKHPAPLPPRPFTVPNKALNNVPPKPRLHIHAEERGIVLQWDMPHNVTPQCYAALSGFDIFGYQEQSNVPINTLLWKKIGSVKAMSLPMACTLTQFVEGSKYHFSIRGVDIHNRCGTYSDPISIVYNTNKSKNT